MGCMTGHFWGNLFGKHFGADGIKSRSAMLRQTLERGMLNKICVNKVHMYLCSGSVSQSEG